MKCKPISERLPGASVFGRTTIGPSTRRRTVLCAVYFHNAYVRMAQLPFLKGSLFDGFLKAEAVFRYARQVHLKSGESL